jgi:hypothetical protein
MAVDLLSPRTSSATSSASSCSARPRSEHGQPAHDRPCEGPGPHCKMFGFMTALARQPRKGPFAMEFSHFEKSPIRTFDVSRGPGWPLFQATENAKDESPIRPHSLTAWMPPLREKADRDFREGEHPYRIHGTRAVRLTAWGRAHKTARVEPGRFHVRTPRWIIGNSARSAHAVKGGGHRLCSPLSSGFLRGGFHGGRVSS